MEGLPGPGPRGLSSQGAWVLQALNDLGSTVTGGDCLRKLLEIAMATCVAQRALFLKAKEGYLVIEAEGAAGEVRCRAPMPLEESRNVSRAVVEEVWSTNRPLIVGDALRDKRFARDPPIDAGGPRSVLCLQVQHGGKSMGILYLENHFTTNAFPPERIETVHLLASYAALCLENASLGESMKREVERRCKSEEELESAREERDRLKTRLQVENTYRHAEFHEQHNINEIVGNSLPLLAAIEKVEQVACTNCTVLIYGETGTGKELVARAIHDRSKRKGDPLVKVSCGAIPAGLVESELYGHVKGAFTGALGRRIGRFEQADGGTIFLDEVGELPPEVQVKLLRVLQEQEFEPIGSSHTIKVDVRIIAATNRDLESEVHSGRFRSDLYYRLNVLPIEVPPLRERKSDIPQLALFFLSRYSRKFGKIVEVVPPETMDRLVNYSWPGNVRELQNIIERAVILSRDRILQIEGHLLTEPLPPRGDSSQSRSSVRRRRAPHAGEERIPPCASARTGLPQLPRRVSVSQILGALQQAQGVIEGPMGAALLLELNPNTLRSRMKKLGIVGPKKLGIIRPA